MIEKIRKEFNIEEYKKVIGKKTNIHKVSYFCKEDLKEINSKKILIFDLEFSMNKIIFEMGGLVLEKGKLKETFFKEYKLPEGEPYWCFKSGGFITEAINKKEKEFSKKDAEWLLEKIEEVDYVVVHNYSAEAQCLAKMKKKEYKAEECELLQNKKFICTNYSFKNKYFKEKGIENTSNNEISKYFGWSVKEIEEEYVIRNKETKFKIKKPKGVKSELHNSFYDTVITLTNLITLSRIKDK